MDSERDVTRIVRSWLREDGHESADRVLSDVLALLDTNTQRLTWWQARRMAAARSLIPLAIAVAAVAVVAVIGINLQPSPGGIGAPSPSTTPTPSPDGTPGPGNWNEIEPGSYVIGTTRTRVQLTMPAGWSGGESGVGLFPGRSQQMLDLAVTQSEISFVVTDACADEAEIDLAPVGPRVEDLTTALTNQTGIQRSGPTDVMLGGYPAKKFVLTLLPACPIRNGIWADASRTYGFGLGHGETATIHVVEVNGDRLVIWSAYMNGASAEHVAQLEAITASIDIEPVPNAGPLPNTADGGWLAMGRHALTVDGVPFSFSVPALLEDRGWARYRDIYISKDTFGSQGAEGAIYWTGFSDGSSTGPCAYLQELPAGESAADLAATVAAAPGTELVSGPSDVTVGGRAAKHVVLTVREDLGCDPGYFFTWDPAAGGPGWWDTSVGDTVRVWIVDVDGTRLVIVGETTPGFGSRLAPEIQDIVDSIQFE